MSWTMKDIEQLKAKGKIRDFVDKKPRKKESKVRQKDKVSYEKLFIESHLKSIWGNDLITEVKFCDDRKFRFDYANKKKMIAIEYEGIYSRKSRHTTQSGYTKDTIKYNLASSLGWIVYRYTASTYKSITNDIPIKTYL